jgi:hypothetical protein
MPEHDAHREHRGCRAEGTGVRPAAMRPAQHDREKRQKKGAPTHPVRWTNATPVKTAARTMAREIMMTADVLDYFSGAK